MVLALCVVCGIASGQIASPPGLAPVPPPPPAPPLEGPIDEGAYPPPAEPEPAGRAPLVLPAASLGVLDKVTGRVRRADLGVGDTLRVGALTLTLRACRSWPDSALPDSAAYLEINESDAEAAIARRIFTGWMFAVAVSVSALEHPVYDVWLASCRTSAVSSSR